MKALVEAGGDGILGFAMIGAEAGEVVAVVQAAMLAGIPYMGLRDAIIAHPTMAEGLGALFSNVPAREGAHRFMVRRRTPPPHPVPASPGAGLDPSTVRVPPRA